jgi:uncharacterized protein YecT (DUF1311 family)
MHWLKPSVLVEISHPMTAPLPKPSSRYAATPSWKHVAKLSVANSKGIIPMSKFNIVLAAFVTLVPSTLLATEAPSDNGSVAVSADHFAYINYILSKDDVANIIRSNDASCPQKSGDGGSTMAAEPRYQIACRNKQVVKIEKQLSAGYKAAKRDLSQQARNQYEAEYLGWARTRYNNCQRDRDENLGGALKNVVFANCKLVELKRRTSWLGLDD